MGTYTVGEYLELFGGLPEPGEAVVDPDELRDAAPPCGGCCGPEGCMARGCPVAR